MAACGGSAKVQTTAEAQPPAAAIPPGTPAESLTTAYLNAQAKLAGDDLKGSRSALGAVRAAAQQPSLEIKEDVRKKLVSSAAQGAAASDIKAVRAAFADLSDAMLAWLGSQPSPVKDSLAVVQCPMARDGKGAHWLQTGDKVRNPYFGSEMLECGTVERTLSPGKKP
jgi:Cu(I)/Ag(I) efflux system membrane fusion protein